MAWIKIRTYILIVLFTFSGIVVSTSELFAQSPKRVELADAIRSLMVDNYDNGTITYFAIQEVASNIKRIEGNNLTVFSGVSDLYVEGHRLALENVTDDYDWEVSITGNTNSFAQAITFDYAHPTRGNTANYYQRYLNDAGFTVKPLMCSYGSGGNNSVLFSVEHSGNMPVFLIKSISTGSAGHFERFTLYWDLKDAILYNLGAVVEVDDIYSAYYSYRCNEIWQNTSD